MKEWIKELAIFLHFHSWRLDDLALNGTNNFKIQTLLQVNIIELKITTKYAQLLPPNKKELSVDDILSLN